MSNPFEAATPEGEQKTIRHPKAMISVSGYQESADWCCVLCVIPNNLKTFLRGSDIIQQ